MRYGAYAPENFDLTFQGTVTVRRALQLSLNVPAVALLDGVGASRLTARLAQAGARAGAAEGRGARPRHGARRRRHQARRPDHALCRAGARRRRRAADRAAQTAPTPPAPRRLLDPVAAWYVGNVLLGTPPPENAAGGRIAFKTGTSYGYRDAWAVGFDGKRTIGVWVGRPDGAPVPGLIGRTAAAPILFDAFARIGRAAVAAAAGAEGRAVRRHRASCRRRCSTSARTARWRATARRRRCASCSRRTARGSSWRQRGGKPDPLALKISGGVEPLTVLVNGVPAVARSRAAARCSSSPTGRASCGSP